MNGFAFAFSRRDWLYFGAGILLVLTGFACIWLDPAPYGFGFLTLWLAPPLLVTGFLLPVFGLCNRSSLQPRLLVQAFHANRPRHIVAFLLFVIAFTTYALTAEPTASLWDCSEAISAAYKLEIPHTPGTPLLLLFGRLFSFFAGHDVRRVAWCVNLMTGFFSAGAVSLLYYIILFFGARWEKAKTGTALIIAASVGALGLTFSDTFWFSAVEAETYGPSCFFMVLIILLILTGSSLPPERRSRRFILILYLSGLGFCVHPMAILPLAMLPYWWYGRATASRIQKALTILWGFVMILIINHYVAVGFFQVSFVIDRFLVNSFHLPFNTGLVVLVFLIAGAGLFAAKRFTSYRPTIWGILFLLAGFTPYLLLMLRAMHKPTMNEYDPENVALMKSYMNRESYPNPPLLYGPYYDAKITGSVIKQTAWYAGTNRYQVAGHVIDYKYDPSRETILPRMYNQDAQSINNYRAWTGLSKTAKPDFFDNLVFLVRYQLGHMYFRYLLWDFAGRDGDIQDSKALWPTDSVTTDDPYNRAHNQYWSIPLVLAVIGLFVQSKRDREGFTSNLIFFLITGIVLVLFLNSPPEEPRERDYIYIGSFMAAWIWVGLGAFTLLNKSGKYLQIPLYVVLLATPAWMAVINWNDHDRSERTFQVDSARDLLASCAPNSILFTGGDNDTFPLWYLQEVEGFRTDVRVMVLSYFNTDWYINSLRRQAYKSAPFKLQLTPDDYRQYGANDVLYVDDMVKEPINAEEFFKLLQKNHPAITSTDQNGDTYHILPSRQLLIPTDSGGMVLRVTKNYLEKAALGILDVILSNNWQRPVYFNYTSLSTAGFDFQDYVVQEGLVYRLVPYKAGSGNSTAMDTGKAYQNLVVHGDYHNLENRDPYFNYEDYTLRMIEPVRQAFNDLGGALLEENKIQQADSVMDFALKNLYRPNLRPSLSCIQAATILVALKQDARVKQLLTPTFNYFHQRAEDELADGSSVVPVDAFILSRSAELLDQVGEKRFLPVANQLLRTK